MFKFLSFVFSVLPFVDLLSIIIGNVQLQRKINHVKLIYIKKWKIHKKYQ